MGNVKSFHEYMSSPKIYNIEPKPNEGPSFDPMLGFPKGRKVRVWTSLKFCRLVIGESPVLSEDMKQSSIIYLSEKRKGAYSGLPSKELKCSKEDIQNYQVPMLYQDYCACQFVDLKKCWIKNNYFERFLGACNHDLHHWHDCIYEDRILVSKEYEREKRLRARRQRRIQMGLEEDPNKTNAENISM